MIENPYLPHLVEILDIRIESKAKDTRTFVVNFTDSKIKNKFKYKPGQFAELSIAGKGEAPISITSSPLQENIEFCIKRMGVVTKAIHNLKVGDKFGVRGPYGNNFPIEDWKGKNLIYIAGGIGLAPVRSVINTTLHESQRALFNEITIIYGARSFGDLLFKPELKIWNDRSDINYFETVDKASNGYTGKVGFVPSLLSEVAPKPCNAIAITCGPPIMIKYVLENLMKLGFEPKQIYTTLEMRMKCGIGKCGRCNIGNKYVCIDGPVFSLEELNNMPKEY